MSTDTIESKKSHSTAAVLKNACRACGKACSQSWFGAAAGGVVRTSTNDVYHQDCFRCHVCSNLIRSGESYMNVGDRNNRQYIHPGCFACIGCKRGIGAGTEYTKDSSDNEEGSYYCIPCHSELFRPRCTICTRTLDQYFLRHPYFDSEVYCLEHDNESRRSCFACNRKEPLPAARKALFVDLLDGRSLCVDCSSTIIVDSSEAAELFRDVIQFMESQLGMSIPEDMRQVPVLVVDYKSLNESISAEGNTALGHHGASGSAGAGTVRGVTLSSCCQVRHIPSGFSLWSRLTTGRPLTTAAASDCDFSSVYHKVDMDEQREVSAVLVLFGLPRDLIASILAHEAMHVWLKLNPRVPFRMTPKVEEGLCQAVSYFYLESLSLTEAAAGNDVEQNMRKYYQHQISTDTSVVYGDGFRAVQHVTSVLGLRIVLEHLEACGELPVT